MYTHGQLWFLLHSCSYWYYEYTLLSGKRILLLFLVLSTSIAIDVLKSSWTGSSTGLEADFSRGRQGLGISQFSERLVTLAETVQTYYGGVYADITILGLVMYWLIRCQPRETANIFIMIFLSTALIPLFIGDGCYKAVSCTIFHFRYRLLYHYIISGEKMVRWFLWHCY